MATLNDQIVTFYRKWDALERAITTSARPIIELDLAPRSTEPIEPHSSRWEAMMESEELIKAIAEDPEDLVEPEVATARLNASNAFLRASMGQRFALGDYVDTYMQFDAFPCGSLELAQLEEAISNEALQIGVEWSHQGHASWQALIEHPTPETAMHDLRTALSKWHELAKQMRPDLELPGYSVEAAGTDQMSFVQPEVGPDGEIALYVSEQPFLPLKRYTPWSTAAHWVGGTLLLHASESARVAAGETDSHRLLWIPHVPDAIPREAILQTVAATALPESKLPDYLLFSERYVMYAAIRLNVAQHWLEKGEPIDHVLAQLTRHCPLTQPGSLLATLASRANRVCDRALALVHGPARREGLSVRALPRAYRGKAILALYDGIPDAGELKAVLRTIEYEARRAHPEHFPRTEFPGEDQVSGGA